jgi:uncharacterized protein
MKSIKIFFIIILLLLSFSVSAYYNPGKPQSFVSDYAEMLSFQARQNLEVKLVQFEKETSNEIAVVTINNLKEDTIENFSGKLFEEWGIGKKDKNNGVLILISKEDREMRIEVGYGLEGALTDAQSYWIIQNIMGPAFRAQDYDKGITEAVDKIIAATKGEYIVSSNESAPINNLAFLKFIFYFLLFTFPIFASILARSKSWWLGGVIGFLIGLIFIFILSLVMGVIITVALTLLGLLFDYMVSKEYQKAKVFGRSPIWWAGGGGFARRGSSGGFSGFGGGLSGGGGSSGRW